MANQSHAANMTQGSIWKLMVRFAIPIFLGNLFQQFYNVADTFIVGNVRARRPWRQLARPAT